MNSTKATVTRGADLGMLDIGLDDRWSGSRTLENKNLKDILEGVQRPHTVCHFNPV